MLALRQVGYSFNAIKERLIQENIDITTRSLQRLEKKFFDHGTYKDLARRKRCKKLSPAMVNFMNEKLTQDDELTSSKLRKLLLENWPELTVSLDTIKHYRRAEGWVCTRPHYCQLIRNINQRKRLAWCEEELRSKDNFFRRVHCSARTTWTIMLSETKTTSKAETKTKTSTKVAYMGCNLISWCISNRYVHWKYECISL